VSSTGPAPATGPRNLPSINLAAIKARLLSLDSRIKNIEKNRTPAPVKIHQISNASQMSMAQAGHTAVLNPDNSVPTGAYQPSPVLATLLFNMPGALSLATSDPMHSRYQSNVVGVSADLTTYSTNVTFEVLVNGAVVSTVTMTSATSGLINIAAHTPLNPYTDLVTVQTTSIGSGNLGLVVHVELAVDPQNPPS
jgi:hypothetical protein